MSTGHGSGLQPRLANGGEMGYGDMRTVQVANKSKSSSGSRERAPESSARRSSKLYTETSNAAQGSGHGTSSSHRTSSSSHRTGSGGGGGSSRDKDGNHSQSSSSKGRTENSASSLSCRREDQRPSARMEEPTSPLPRGWSVAFSRSGRKYYFNEIDMTKSWEKPTCANPAESGGSARPVRSPSTATSDRHSSKDNNKRAPYSGDESGGRATGVRMEIASGGPSTTVSLPRKSSAARAASRGAGAAPPALPARPRHDPGEGSPSEKTESRSSGSRDTSRGSSSREESHPSDSRDASHNSSGRSVSRLLGSRDASHEPSRREESRPSGSRAASHSGSSSTSPEDRNMPVESGSGDGSHTSSSRRRGDRDIEERALGHQIPGSGTRSEAKEGSTSRSAHGDQRSERVKSATGQTSGTASSDAPTQAEEPAFDPALFMPAGMQLPKKAQEQFIKQMQAMPKQQQQMIMQQMMMQNPQQAATQKRGQYVTPGAAATAAPTVGSPSNAAQPALYRGNPGDKNQGIYTSDLAAGFSKGMGKLIKKMGSAPNVKAPPKGYVGMSGGGFTTPGNYSAKDLKRPKLKKPSSSSKEEKEGMGIKMLNGAMKKGLSLAGLGDCKVKVKKTKKGGYKWKGKADLSDSDEENECDGEDGQAECESEKQEVEEGEEGAEEGDEGAEEGEEPEEEEGEATGWGKMPGLPVPSMCL